MTKLTNRSIAAVAAVFATIVTVSAAAPAQAAPASIEVGYADLDIRSEAGAEALQRRIDRAASRICVDAGGPLVVARCRANVVGETKDRLAARLAPAAGIQLASAR